MNIKIKIAIVILFLLPSIAASKEVVLESKMGVPEGTVTKEVVDGRIEFLVSDIALKAPKDDVELPGIILGIESADGSAVLNIIISRFPNGMNFIGYRYFEKGRLIAKRIIRSRISLKKPVKIWLDYHEDGKVSFGAFERDREIETIIKKPVLMYGVNGAKAKISF
jgi:hypothetical protein